MTAADLMPGFLAGLLSCLTPEVLTLLPLLLAAMGAPNRARTIALAVGLGLSLVLTGLLAGSLADLLGVDALWFRRCICLLLFALGFMLTSGSLTERFPRLTGGRGSVFGEAREASLGGAFRLLMLAILVGANWLPLLGPTLGNASLRTADLKDSGLAPLILFVFGMGAALPLVFAGRAVRMMMRPFAAGLLQGMVGKRLLGMALLAVAALGGLGFDAAVGRHLDPLLPAWTHRLATSF